MYCLRADGPRFLFNGLRAKADFAAPIRAAGWVERYRAFGWRGVARWAAAYGATISDAGSQLIFGSEQQRAPE